ncbi:MAG: hypothetical protein E7256_04240 [Lachnospiraceae bacterium]|nr:hypothetical protein [Lachnospiraceae bacterium]
MSGQKPLLFLTIRQKTTVCYSRTVTAFVRHEPDIPDIRSLRSQEALAMPATSSYALCLVRREAAWERLR